MTGTALDPAPAPATSGAAGVPPAAARSQGRRAAVLGAVGAAGFGAVAVLGVSAAIHSTTGGGQAAPAGTAQTWNHLGPRGHGWSVPGSAGTGTAGSGSTSTASAAQQVGVVEIDSRLGYQNAEAAGTGMILTSDGEVLTNNHVVDGATSITVTVVSTGDQYTATVVGTAPADDVAVLRLQNAAHLQPVTIRSAAAQVGEAVTAVGDAGGDGGSLTAAPGQVVGVDRSITAADSNGADAQQLSGLVEVDAAVESGDSGGPLYDGSGQVIGMDTAASTGGAPDAYAIPITTATGVADRILAGTTTDGGTIHQGYPAFLGVSVQDTASGAEVTDVASGSAADSAGLQSGDVITAVGGTPVTSATSLKSALAGHDPGDRVALRWTDTSGAAHGATVALGAGPAD